MVPDWKVSEDFTCLAVLATLLLGKIQLNQMTFKWRDPCIEVPKSGSLRAEYGKAKMSRKLGLKNGWLALAAIAVVIFVVPAAEATPIDYNFTVDVTSGPLSGTSSSGSFSYDSSSVVPGGFNQQLGLLTASGFTFNDIRYDDTVNTGYLGFDAAGDLTSFVIGSDCSYVQSVGYETCVATGGSDGWYIASVNEFLGTAFTYSTSTFNDFGYGNVSFALASTPPVSSVPEPGAFGMFGLGTLLIGLCAERRRRMG